MEDHPRLIEVAFPLKQASLDSVHEKNVRHGHISTLHIWPARRPLAACRAALIATLLPDPGTPEKRQALLEKIGGKVVTEVMKKKVGGKTIEVVKERTEGGVLHWGNENSPDMDWFREEIKKAYGGRAPRVLDPFAGGGAIPLEAMRLGCEATAIDINPVAWFILKCTLEYPQKLAGQVRPLPKFALESEEFMEAYLKGTGKLSKTRAAKELVKYQRGLFPPPEADLAWHVRAWGWWVLQQARKDLERFYPTIDGKPTVAYLWARTLTCKNCRATVPLLKTRWLCKKENKRVLLTMEPNADKTGVVFGIQNHVSLVGCNAAQQREFDKKIGAGTMTQSGARCPLCQIILTWDDLRTEGQAERFGSTPLAVIVDAKAGKEYRLPDSLEIQAVIDSEAAVEKVSWQIPNGIPNEPTPEPFGPRRHGAALRRYGMYTWASMFTYRQLSALCTFLTITRSVKGHMLADGYTQEWADSVVPYLGIAIDRLADYSSSICSWINTLEAVRNTFGRFAFPIVWDYAEVHPTSRTAGGYWGAIDWIALYLSHAQRAAATASPAPTVLNQSSISYLPAQYDVILTDPPYYDAISYCDLMDFFHVWLRRCLKGHNQTIDESFKNPLGPKWNHEFNDGELVDDPSRHQWNRIKSKAVYEDGMFRAFSGCREMLKDNGRFVVIFAHKYPEAWEALVSAIIRAGFVVDGSWPIQTERGSRTRALSSSALSSSVWLVCKKRSDSARPGWDNRVLEEMRHNIHNRLRDYWDAGIRGPDFVWAATGPAMEAYSKHPVVKKANEPGKLMEVSEFLRAVRRLVVDFVVGRVLTGGDETSASGLDDVTTYYILHRHDFGVSDAPVGPCILYAISCNLSDRDLADRFDILLRTGGLSSADDDDEVDEEEKTDADAEPEEGTGSIVKLRPWHQRKRKSIGFDTEGHPAPLIDQVHRLMHLWKTGEVAKVDDYLDSRGLRKNALFLYLLQALIELSRRDEQRDELVILENLSNHLQSRGVAPTRSVTLPGLGDDDQNEAGSE